MEFENSTCIHTFEEHKDSVFSVAVSPDGKYVISGSKDETVKVWELATGKLVHILKGHKIWCGQWVSLLTENMSSVGQKTIS